MAIKVDVKQRQFMEVSLYLESSRSIISKTGPLYAPFHSRKSHMGCQLQARVLVQTAHTKAV